MIDIYEIIKRINANKAASNIEPISATYEEIVVEMTALAKKDINQLVNDKKVEFHRTLNGLSFDLIKQQ